MKKLLLVPLLLCAVLFSLTAQVPFPGLSTEGWQRLPKPTIERDNSTFRLDSMYRFSFAAETDSTLKNRIRYNYFGDTLRVTTTERNEAPSGFSPVPESVEEVRWDALGRSISNTFRFWDGTDYQFANAHSFFWHGNSTEVYDSVYAYAQQNGVIFNDSRTYYEFLQGTELVTNQTLVALDATGAVTQTTQTQTDYNPDQTISQEVVSTMLPGGSEQIDYRTTYTYSGDTVTAAAQLYDSANGAWLTATQKSVSVAAPGSGLTLSIQAYELTISGDAYRLVAEVFFEYDIEDRNTAIDAYGYFTPDTQRVRNTYAYLSGNTIAQTARFSRSSAASPWKIKQREYYFYTEISGTNSLNTQPVNVKVSPNPASDAVWLDTGGPAIQTVQVLDASGRVVRSVSNIQQNHWRLERNGLPAGLYRARVRTERSSAVVSFIFE